MAENMFAKCPNEIVEGKTRIQFLTERLIRLEWQEDGVFEDRQTLSAIKRDLGTVEFTRETKKGRKLFKTASTTVEVLDANAPLDKGGLRISFSLNGKKKTWRPGDDDSGNLGGTCRSLDCADGEFAMRPSDQKGALPARQVYELKPLEKGRGFVSRDGWSLIDDSACAALDFSKGFKWFAGRHGEKRQDWYFFAYGRDCSAALADAAKVFGRQPLPPRWTLGYWWSRYWPYSDADLEQLTDDFAKQGIPLDVLVIDMDWHLPGWTGYTWDDAYFPNPGEFLARLHANGVKVSLNLHPGDGVDRREAQFPAMCEELGLDPENTEKIPFDYADPKFMKAYFKILHNPEEKRGVDFWWLDWSEGDWSKVKGLDSLLWMNQLHWDDQERRGDKRPLIFSRYGGLGGNRCNIGFSGDVYSTWRSLAYETFFTATAANSLFGYWSHDIGGFQHCSWDPELYARWLQFGVFSPILRTHCAKTTGVERRPWKYPDPYSGVMKDAIRLRHRMIPYIYSENRKSFDGAPSLCHPIYYKYPDEKQAGSFKHEYMFGSQILAAPVVEPCDKSSALSEKEVWLPPGEWFDSARGVFEKGGRTIKRKYLLCEIPAFVRPGTLIPCVQDGCKIGAPCLERLAIDAYPGDGTYELYEDDGVSQDYMNGDFALIEMKQSSCDRKRTLELKHVKGSYKGYVPKRSLEATFKCSVPPAEISVNGRRLAWSFRLDDLEEGWTYDCRKAEAKAKIAIVNLDAGAVVKALYPDGGALRGANALQGVFNRMEMLRDAGVALCYWQPLHPEERLPQKMFSAARRVSLEPSRFHEEMANLRKGLPHLREVFEKHGRLGPDGKILEERLALRRKALSLLDDIAAILRSSK